MKRFGGGNLLKKNTNIIKDKKLRSAQRVQGTLDQVKTTRVQRRCEIVKLRHFTISRQKLAHAQDIWDRGNKTLEKQMVLKRNSWGNIFQLIRLTGNRLIEVKMGRGSPICKKKNCI